MIGSVLISLAQTMGFIFNGKTHGLHGIFNSMITPKLNDDFFRNLAFFLGLITLPYFLYINQVSHVAITD